MSEVVTDILWDANLYRVARIPPTMSSFWHSIRPWCSLVTQITISTFVSIRERSVQIEITTDQILLKQRPLIDFKFDSNHLLYPGLNHTIHEGLVGFHQSATTQHIQQKVKLKFVYRQYHEKIPKHFRHFLFWGRLRRRAKNQLPPDGDVKPRNMDLSPRPYIH